MAEQEIVEPIVVTEKKELLVPNFNKKEVEEIVRETVKNKISSYPVADEILEIDGDSHTLTDEAYAFILKCFEAGKIAFGGQLCNLNYTHFNGEHRLDGICFGCMTSTSVANHTVNGTHLEIEINWDVETPTYTVYDAEI